MSILNNIIHNAFCKNTDGSFECDCIAGFALDEDNTTCIVIPEPEIPEDDQVTCGSIYSEGDDSSGCFEIQGRNQIK